MKPTVNQLILLLNIHRGTENQEKCETTSNDLLILRNNNLITIDKEGGEYTITQLGIKYVEKIKEAIDLDKVTGGLLFRTIYSAEIDPEDLVDGEESQFYFSLLDQNEDNTLVLIYNSKEEVDMVLSRDSLLKTSFLKRKYRVDIEEVITGNLPLQASHIGDDIALWDRKEGQNITCLGSKVINIKRIN